MPGQHDSVTMGIHTQHGSQVVLEAVEIPQGMVAYLEDLKTGEWHSLKESSNFYAR
ncbi:MAG: hypothetical protein U5L96_07985 [Owenweeksia sp.]|nr:hypothetical protein [Owenweeksia sp.]